WRPAPLILPDARLRAGRRSSKRRKIRDNALRFRTSGKGAVQEPRRRTGAMREIAVKPGAEQPESKPAFVLDAEVIARRPAVLAPPGAFDAFRPFGGNHLVQRAPPTEAQRRAVRYLRHCF